MRERERGGRETDKERQGEGGRETDREIESRVSLLSFLLRYSLTINSYDNKSSSLLPDLQQNYEPRVVIRGNVEVDERMF